MSTIEYEVITLAGGAEGFVDSEGAKARFNRPNGLAIGRQGSVFVADFGNNAIRKVTPDGEVSTIAGSRSGAMQDGLAALATFQKPRGLVFDDRGNLYVSDFGNNAVRKINPDLEVNTLAGSGVKGSAEGHGRTANFEEVRDITYNSGYIFAVDRYKIRRISLLGDVSTFAGGTESGEADGIGIQARFGTLSAIAADQQGNLFVVDADNSTIRFITPIQKVGTLAGANMIPAEGSNTFLQSPLGIAIDQEGNCWVTDIGDYTVKKISPKGMITQIAGSLTSGHKDGPAMQAEFKHPSGIAVGNDGRVYVTDLATHSLRCIVPKQ